MKLKPKALLFDMDGVLIDSLDSWWLALNDALKLFNHQELSREEFIKTYWGHDLRDNLRRLKLHPDVAKFCNVTYGNHLNSIKLYSDTLLTLQKLVAYQKAVITNTPADCAEQILNKFGIKQFFDFVVTSDDVIKAKPDPEIIFKACAHLGVQPNAVVMVGDTQSDVNAARAAGCTVVGLNITADVTIQRLSELLDLLQ